MTRNRKVDPAVLEREYIFDSSNPPVSISGLAEKYGMARSGIADKAMKGHWYERRIEFREQLGEKVVAALGDEWVGFETQTREKLMQVGLKYLDKYVAALDEGSVKPNTRDMLGIAAMIRTLLGDVAASPKGEEALIDPDTVDVSPEYYRQAIAAIEAAQLGSGEADAGPAGETEEAGPTGTGED
jgi:hypothetical protein